MKPIQTLFLAITMALSAAALAGQGGVAQPIQSYYIKTDALTMKKDVAGLSKLMTDSSTPDFVFVGKPNKQGKTTTRSRAQTVQDLGHVMPMIAKFTKVVSHIDRSSASSGGTVLMVTSTVEMNTVVGPDGKAHSIVNHGKSQDTWVRVGGIWKIKSSKSISDNMTIDGKPIPGQ